MSLPQSPSWRPTPPPWPFISFFARCSAALRLPQVDGSPAFDLLPSGAYGTLVSRPPRVSGRQATHLSRPARSPNGFVVPLMSISPSWLCAITYLSVSAFSILSHALLDTNH